MSSEQRLNDDVRRFYDQLAGHYDTMTDFQRRLDAERPVVRALMQRYPMRRVLDAGCGTGVHALLLAQEGAAVTAVDISAPMVLALREHAQRMALPVETVESDFLSLAGRVRGPFEAVMCFGNSLPHLRTRGELEAVFEIFFELLAPGGTLLVQVLNYDLILAERKHQLHRRESGGRTYERSYTYEEDYILFRVDVESDGTAALAPERMEVRLKPWRHAELLAALAGAGFAPAEAFGSTALAAFDPSSSRDLVLAVLKPQ